MDHPKSWLCFLPKFGMIYVKAMVLILKEFYLVEITVARPTQR